MRRARTKQGESERFPGFADVCPIGEGGFSTVYRARELAANRFVALKLLRVAPEVSPHAVECFQRETLALGALSAHPHILTLYRSFTTADGRPVLVLELCRSSAARELRDGGGFALSDGLALAIKVAGALETAHRAGMLHRDVKPQNILLTEYGEPALADFGVAHLHERGPMSGGVVAFTTLHAAPELLEGAPPTPATDVYGLASSLYELLAGQPAFRAFDGESPASVALRVLRDPVPPLLSVPMALSDLLVAAMAKSPGARPASALEFASALSVIAQGAGAPPIRLLVGPPAEPPPPEPPPPAAQPPAVTQSLAPPVALPLGTDVDARHGPAAPARPDPPEVLVRLAAAVIVPPASSRRVVPPSPGHRPGDPPAPVAPGATPPPTVGAGAGPVPADTSGASPGWGAHSGEVPPLVGQLLGTGPDSFLELGALEDTLMRPRPGQPVPPPPPRERPGFLRRIRRERSTPSD